MVGKDEPQAETSGIDPIDTSRPSIARVHDAFLGGKDNYAVDQALCRAIVDLAPEAPAMAKAVREWLVRVVSFLSRDLSITQFLDCGSGLPTAENTHTAARRHNPDSTVIYSDIDPMVASHSRALLEDNDRTHFAAADLREPTTLLTHPVVEKHLDLSTPLALIQSSTLHHVADDDDPHKIMADFIDALPSGSYVAISHWHDPADGSKRSELARTLENAMGRSNMGTGRFRTYDEIASLFDGLEMIEPGLTTLFSWWPDGPQLTPPPDGLYLVLGGLGRKP